MPEGAALCPCQSWAMAPRHHGATVVARAVSPVASSWGKARCGSVLSGGGPKGRGKPGSQQQSELLLRDIPLGPRSVLAEQARLGTHRRAISSPLILPALGMEDRGFILFALNCPGLNSSVGSSCLLGQRVI